MWPPWSEWDLALTGHAERRMEERGITEVDLRSMLQRATGYAPSVVERRFMITTSHGGRPWVVIVEPVGDERLLVVVTAYEAVR